MAAARRGRGQVRGRRLTALVGAVLLAVTVLPLGAGLVSPAAAAEACTITGTQGPDVLTGTSGRDVICGRGGNDQLDGLEGQDVLRGGSGADVLRGSGGDVLYGGTGNDTVYGRDPAGLQDTVDCGAGNDRAFADLADLVRRDCETVTRNRPPTDVTLSPAAVAENQPAGTVVGQLAATDLDAGESHTFALVAGAGSADNASFAVSGSDLETTAPLDYETEPPRDVRRLWCVPGST